MNSYLQDHIAKGMYLDASGHDGRAGLRIFKSKNGWNDCYVGQHFVFSHRITDYDNNSFPESFHSHEFYEMDIYCGGNIKYVSDQQEIVPKRDDILIFPPGCSHTAKLVGSSRYERIVFYFSKAFFTDIDRQLFPELFRDAHVNCRVVLRESRGEFFYLLEKLKNIAYADKPDDGLLAYSYLLRLLHLIAHETVSNSKRIVAIPQKILDIKVYADSNFTSIKTASEVAEHFFYSREYVSRIFKQYYNISLSDYLQNKKLEYGGNLLKSGQSVGYACDASGFRSMSAFVSAFRGKYGVTPSQYKHANLKEREKR